MFSYLFGTETPNHELSLIQEYPYFLRIITLSVKGNLLDCQFAFIVWNKCVAFCELMLLLLQILLTVVYTALKHRQDPCVLDHYDDGFYGMDNELARRRKQREVECEEWEELERVRYSYSC